MTKLDEIAKRIRKLLALAENNRSEHESLSAMAQAHRLMAAYNLSADEVRARPIDGPRRTLDKTQFDAAAERWTVDIWHVTAELFFCRYFYRQELVGRSTRRLRHCIVGTAANQVTAKVMADHFCRTIRRLACEFAPADRSAAARRSFEGGCADRLRERIWQRRTETCTVGEPGNRLPALLDLYDRERAANDAALGAFGITVDRTSRAVPRKRADVGAEHLGREAAESISLSLQIGAGAVPVRPAQVDQMAFGF